MTEEMEVTIPERHSKVRWWWSRRPHYDQFDMYIVRYEWYEGNYENRKGFALTATGGYIQVVEGEELPEPFFTMTGHTAHMLVQALDTGVRVNEDEFVEKLFQGVKDMIAMLGGLDLPEGALVEKPIRHEEGMGIGNYLGK